MKLARSKIHRWGVYSTERIPAGRKVIEYTGERISRRETKRRADGTDLIYLFTLDDYWTLDGSVGGSGAEYINHSCDPNTAFIGLDVLAVRSIRRGEELTLDYAAAMNEHSEPFTCHCGSPKCRGLIEGTPGNCVTTRLERRGLPRDAPP